MMTFREALDKKAHKNGTYICANLSTDNKFDIFSWVEENKIPNPCSPSQYHCTVVYSRKGIPDAVSDPILKTQAKAKASSWKIFPSQEGKKCLVLHLESEDLDKAFRHFKKKYGAVYDFPSYEPHITVSYDYGTDVIPKTLPLTEITFTCYHIDALDPDKVIK